jgi:hypothetical protein
MTSGTGYEGTEQGGSAEEPTVVVTAKNILLSLNEEQQERLKACVNKGSIRIEFDTIPLTELPSFSSGPGGGVAID